MTDTKVILLVSGLVTVVGLVAMALESRVYESPEAKECRSKGGTYTGTRGEPIKCRQPSKEEK